MCCVFCAEGLLEEDLRAPFASQHARDGGLQVNRHLLPGVVSPVPVLDQSHENARQSDLLVDTTTEQSKPDFKRCS